MGKNNRKKQRTSSNWKSYQNNSHSKRKVFLGLSALFVIVLIIIIAKAVSFITGINSPFNPENNQNTQSFYSTTSSTLTLAVRAENDYLLSINPVSKKLTLIRLSPELYLQTPSGGQILKKISSANILSHTLRSAFGTYIDGYLIFPQDSTVEFENFAKDLKKGAGMMYLLQDVKTDLSLVGLIKLNLMARSIRDDNFEIVDLSASTSTKWQVLKDGSRVLSVDQSSLDRQFSGTFEDTKLSMEGLNIAVFNSTSHPGLAEKAAREITSMGGRVVSTDTIKSNQEKSIVFGKSSYTLSRLSFVYHSHCLEGLFSSGCAKMASELKNQDPSFETGSSKADVIVVLGEDFYNNYVNLDNSISYSGRDIVFSSLAVYEKLPGKTQAFSF